MELAQQLAHTLENTISPDPVVRSDAENFIYTLESSKQSGLIAALLQITHFNKASLSVRQAAALRLKNISHEAIAISRFEDETMKVEKRMSTEDIAFLTNHIVESVIKQTETCLRVQVLDVFYRLLRNQPNWVSGALQTIHHFIQTASFEDVYGAVAALHVVYKYYRYKSAKERQALQHISTEFMPILLPIYEKAVEQRLFDLCRLITKIYFLETQNSLSLAMRDSSVFNRWQSCFITILNQNNGVSEGFERQASLRNPLSKAQKWAARIVLRMLVKYTNVKSTDQEKVFSDFHLAHGAPQVLESFLGIFVKASQGVPYPNSLMCSATCYIQNAVDYGVLYTMLKPHLSVVLETVLVPLMRLSQDDLELWEADPRDFVFQELGATEDPYTPSTNAAQLLKHLIRVRTRDTLPLVLQFVFQAMQHKTGTLDSILKIDAALNMIGSISSLLHSKDDLKDVVLQILNSVVLPTLALPTNDTNRILVRRSCWFVSKFVQSLPSEPTVYVSQHIVRLIQDADLAVRMNSAIALTELLQLKPTRDTIRPILSQVLDSLFSLLGEVQCAEGVAALDSIIGCFDTDIAPFAIELVKRFMSVFDQLTMANDNDEDTEEESLMAGFEAIRSINTVIYSVSDMPEVLLSLEPVVAPILEKAISFDGMDITGDALEMINSFTLYQSSISPYMWSYLPRLLVAMRTYGIDFLPVMYSPISNYMKLQNETFCNGGQHVELLLGACADVFANADDITARHCARYLNTLLLYSPNRINAYVAQIVHIVIQKLAAVKEEDDSSLSLQAGLLHTMGHAALYDAQLFIQSLEAIQATESLLLSWISFTPEMAPSLLKVAILGQSSLLRVLPTLQNAALQKHTLHLVGSLINALDLLKKHDHSKDDGTAQDQDYASDDFVDVPEDADFLDANELDLMNGFSEFIGSGYNPCDFGDFDDDEEEEEASPLDEMNAFWFFSSCLRQAGDRVFELISNDMDPPLKQHLQSLLEYAEA